VGSSPTSGAISVPQIPVDKTLKIVGMKKFFEKFGYERFNG